MSDFVEKNTAYIISKLKEMQDALDKMSPEELRSKIESSVGEDDGYKHYATLERFILSGDEVIGPQHTIIAKKDLLDGEYYRGDCRNADYAVWIKKIGKFVYIREKFGDKFPETINHPEDDDGYDLFLPFSLIKSWKDVPEKNHVSVKDICEITGSCPHFFFSKETQELVTPEMKQIIDDQFPEEQYGDILWFEGWPLRDILQQALVMGAWLEKNKKCEIILPVKKESIKLSKATEEELSGLPKD